MRCPKCGNEISQEEAFCGQCGTSTLSLTQPGQSRSYTTNVAPPTSPNPASIVPPPSQSYNGGPPPLSLPSRRPLTPDQPQPPLQPPGTQQQQGFYADPTEAFSVLPSNSPPSYPQQSFPGTPGPYNPQIQPYRLGNYTSPSYPQPQTPPSGPSYGYGMQPNFAPPPRKERSNTILIIACVFLIVALLMVAGLGAFYLLRNRSSQAGTAAPSPVATTAAATTASPAPTPAATNVPTPLPTTIPSPIAEAGFTFCDATCTSNGFSVEYPSKWQQGTTTDHTDVQFSNASANQDEYAAFKLAGSTQATANDLINADLQANFASKPGYVAPTSSKSTTIGGVTWVYSQASYSLNGQTQRVQVYATVHQAKAYIIELNASDTRFDAVNGKYFVTMLGSFKFQ